MQRGKSIVFLHDERSRCDIGEEHAHREHVYQHITQEFPVTEHIHKAFRDGTERGLAIHAEVLERQAFVHADRPDEQDESQDNKAPENGSPAAQQCDESAYDRRRHGGDAIYGCDHGHHLRKLLSLVFVCCNAT